MFPSYKITYAPHKSDLAWLESKGDKIRLILESTGEVLYIDTPEDLVNTIFYKELMVFMTDFVDEGVFYHQYMQWFVNNPLCSCICTEYGDIKMIRIAETTKRNSKIRYIVSLKVWKFEEPNQLDLITLARLFKYTEVGAHPSPAALGSNILIRSFGNSKDGKRPHTTPDGFMTQFLHEHLIGGRVQNFAPRTRTYEKVDQYDIASAHLSEFNFMPDGTVVQLHGDRDAVNYPYSVMNCEVIIHSELALGPFPFWNKDGDLSYPTRKGTYRTVLSSGRIQDAKDVGCTVSCYSGRGWSKYTNDMSEFVDTMWKLRCEADSDLVLPIKMATVSAIGRHASNGHYFHLVEHGKGKPMSGLSHGIPVTTSYYDIAEEVDDNPAAMIHWFYAVTEETARKVYKYALPAAEQGRLLAINFDGWFVDPSHGYDRMEFFKYDHYGFLPDREDKRLGEPTWETITNVRFPYPRAIVCDQFSKTPGETH